MRKMTAFRFKDSTLSNIDNCQKMLAAELLEQGREWEANNITRTQVVERALIDFTNALLQRRAAQTKRATKKGR